MAVSSTTSVIFESVGDDLLVQHDITGLLEQITASEFGLKHSESDTTPFATWAITSTPSAAGQIVDPGTQDNPPDGPYTAQVAFSLSGSSDGETGDTLVNFKPGVTEWAYIRSTTTSGKHYTSEIIAITPKVGGKYG